MYMGLSIWPLVLELPVSVCKTHKGNTDDQQWVLSLADRLVFAHTITNNDLIRLFPAGLQPDKTWLGCTMLHNSCTHHALHRACILLYR